MDLDITLFLQLGLFLLTLVVLNSLLFKPFLRVLDARYEKLHGAQHEVERLSKNAATDLEVYNARLREARELAQKEREALVAAGREEERRLLAEVRNDIAKQLNAAREQVSRAELEAKQALTADTDALARRMVEKVLGREVRS